METKDSLAFGFPETRLLMEFPTYEKKKMRFQNIISHSEPGEESYAKINDAHFHRN